MHYEDFSPLLQLGSVWLFDNIVEELLGLNAVMHKNIIYTLEK